MGDPSPSLCGDLPQSSEVSGPEFEALTSEALRRWGLADRVPVEVAKRFGSLAGLRCSASWSPNEEPKYALLLVGEDQESGIALSNDSGYLKGTIFHGRQTQPEFPPAEQWDIFVGVPADGEEGISDVSIGSLMKNEATAARSDASRHTD